MTTEVIGSIAIIWVLVTLFQAILFFKVWFMCNDVRRIHDRLHEPLDDIRFWDRARYESEKRRGIILEVDIQKAEKFIDETSSDAKYK